MARIFTPAEQAAWEAERQEAYIASLGDLGNQGDESGSNMGSGGEGAGPNHDDEDEEEDPEEVPTPYRNRAATADISMSTSGYREYSLSIDAMNVLPDVLPVQYTPPPPSPRRATVPGKPIDVLALRDQLLHDRRKNTARIIGPSTSSTHVPSTQSAEKSSPDIKSRTSLDRDEGFGEPTELLGLALGPFPKDWQPPKTGLRGHEKVEAFFAVERGRAKRFEYIKSTDFRLNNVINQDAVTYFNDNCDSDNIRGLCAAFWHLLDASLDITFTPKHHVSLHWAFVIIVTHDLSRRRLCTTAKRLVLTS
jgi:hypothetical protein